MLCNTRVLTQDELVRKCQQAQRKIEGERVRGSVGFSVGLGFSRSAEGN